MIYLGEGAGGEGISGRRGTDGGVTNRRTSRQRYATAAVFRHAVGLLLH